MKFTEARGSLVGAVVVDDDDEVFSIKASGGVTRVSVGEVNPTGRVTMGVRFISLADDDTVVAIARNAERAAVEEELGRGTGRAVGRSRRRHRDRGREPGRACRRRGDRRVSTPGASRARTSGARRQPTATMAPVTDTMAAADATAPRRQPGPGPQGAARARPGRPVVGHEAVVPAGHRAWRSWRWSRSFVLWSVLDTMGVFDSVGSTVESVTRSQRQRPGHRHPRLRRPQPGAHHHRRALGGQRRC